MTSASAQRLYALGQLREKRKQWESAGAAYQAALAKDDSSAEWHFRLGAVREQQHNVSGAAAAYEAALARDATLPGLPARLAHMKAVLAQWEATDDMYRMEMGPDGMAAEMVCTIERDVLCIKLGRTPARVVSRVHVVHSETQRVTLIEKLILEQMTQTIAEDVVKIPELYFLKRVKNNSDLISIPEIHSQSLFGGGILLIQSDLANCTKSFAPVHFDCTVESTRSIVQALALFNTQMEFDAGAEDTLFRIDSTCNTTFAPVEAKVSSWRSLRALTSEDGVQIDLTEEIDQFLICYRDILKDLISKNGVVTCHGDPAPGNMFQNHQNVFGFIDFERFCLAPPGFDLGLLFVFLFRAALAREEPRPAPEVFLNFFETLTDIYIEQISRDRHGLSSHAIRIASACSFALSLLSPPRGIYRRLFRKNADTGDRKMAQFLLKRALDTALSALPPSKDGLHIQRAPRGRFIKQNAVQ